MRRFWKKNDTIITGSENKVAKDVIEPHIIPCCELNSAIANGAVFVAVDVSIKENRKSFQEARKLKIAVVPIPPVTTGTITLIKAPIRYNHLFEQLLPIQPESLQKSWKATKWKMVN